MGCKQQTDRKIVSNLTHVILDEIHERDKFADFLLIELREMVKAKTLKKLILMSATIDLDFFVKYFQRENIEPSIVEVEGRTGQVDQWFLEDIFSTDEDIRDMISDRLKEKERERFLIDTLASISNENGETDTISTQEKTPFDDIMADISALLEPISVKVNADCTD